jgi:hypothetical protein
VYRHQIRPVVEKGAVVMDQIFDGSGKANGFRNGFTQESDPEDEKPTGPTT